MWSLASCFLAKIQKKLFPLLTLSVGQQNLRQLGQERGPSPLLVVIEIVAGEPVNGGFGSSVWTPPTPMPGYRSSSARADLSCYPARRLATR